MVTPNIAFIGKAGAGKTTAAEMLVKYYAYERLSLAAPLKIMVDSDTDRGKLQDAGIGLRELCPDALVNLLIHEKGQRDNRERVTWSGGPFGGYTVDDCRFPNEALRLKLEDFIIVRIEAHRYVRRDRLKANGKLQGEEQLDHQSERGLDDYTPDYTIWNAGSDPEALLDNLTKILNRERP